MKRFLLMATMALGCACCALASNAVAGEIGADSAAVTQAPPSAGVETTPGGTDATPAGEIAASPAGSTAAAPSQALNPKTAGGRTSTAPHRTAARRARHSGSDDDLARTKTAHHDPIRPTAFVRNFAYRPDSYLLIIGGIAAFVVASFLLFWGLSR